MKTSSSRQTGAFDEDAALTELTSILPAADRLRFAALGRVGLLSTAKQKSLLRVEKALVARNGPSAPQVRNARSRLEIEKRFDVAIAVEKQRTQATTVTRNPEALTLHGRVVTARRLAVPDLTVSAIDSQGKAVVFSGTDANGYFSLAVPVGEDTAGQSVTLLVSDREQAVHYRGTECFARKPGAIHYRELVTGATAPTQPPVPPPDVDPKSVTVPDVRGLREDAATARLRALSLKVESSTRASGGENIGRVIEQEPQPGTAVAPCSTVKIVVGAAPPAVKVPDLVGRTIEEADAILAESGLVRGTVQPPEAPPEARVVQQSPAAGTEVAPQTPINLVVRVDLPPVTVPNVVESTLTAARKILEEAGLRNVRVDPPDAPDNSLVVAQDPGAGAQVQPDAAVVLKVRSSSPMVNVPSLLRMEFVAARHALEKAGLKLGKVKPKDPPDTSIVIQQSPEAGSTVAPGSDIDLEVRVAEPSPPRPQPPDTRPDRPGRGPASRRSPANRSQGRPKKKADEKET